MTNKERLELNNAKIARIQETLINKMLNCVAKLTWTKLNDGSFSLELSTK